jgi:F-type H+-transporting ATPase subunit epsilon
MYDDQGREQRLAIGGGFFQVVNNDAILLADSAEYSADIDAARAQEAERRARSRLAGELEPAQEVQRDRAEAALKRAKARLRVAAGR